MADPNTSPELPSCLIYRPSLVSSHAVFFTGQRDRIMEIAETSARGIGVFLPHDADTLVVEFGLAVSPNALQPEARGNGR